MLLLLHECGRFLGLLMVLYGFGWFWPVIYCNGSFGMTCGLIFEDLP